MNNKLVSIITPVYNSEKYLRETINSVKKQTFKNWELILVDNGSTDESVKIINEYLIDDERIKLIKLGKNYGPSKARNVGIKQANGNYMCFLDSDDILCKYFIDKQVNFMKSKNAKIVYSSFYKKSEDLSKNYGAYKIKEKVSYKDLLKKNYLSCLTVMIDLDKSGKMYFNENIKHEDHLYWIDILKNNNDFAYGNEEILATYRIRQGSLSRNKLKAATWKWNIYRNELKFNLFKSLYYFSFYSLNGFLSNYKYIVSKGK